MTKHIVKQGEHGVGIAMQCGFADFRKILDCPENSELKQKRKRPTVLNPGDRVFIPELEKKTVPGVTEKCHHFRSKVTQLFLKFILKDINDDPITDTECTLIVAGEAYELRTDGNGKIEQSIPATAREGTLKILKTTHTLLIGHLDPVSEISGQQARLSNLGYYTGSIDNNCNNGLLSAVEEFQCDQKLSVDGICGEKTQTKLSEIYGC